MKLEHIAPYLPYKLKVLYTHTNKSGVISNIYTIGEGYGDEDTKISIGHYEGEHLWMFKPILRPLSDLTKEITHNGETIKPIDYISTSIKDGQTTMRRVENGQKLDVLEYWKIERLLSLHFDVFGLIESGEAIDINTLR